MPICNTDNFINQLQTEINSIVGDDIAWKSIDTSRNIAASIKIDGTLWTWGYNSLGQLGSGNNITRCSPGTVAGGGTTWCDVSSGRYHVGAIKTDGTLWTWGWNNNGRLGNGTTVNRSSPGTVAGGGTTWCQVSVTNDNTSAIKTDGTLWTWGFNGNGILGDGTTVSRSSPGTVAGGGTTWCQVSVMDERAAAIKTDGTLWTWGLNNFGQLGDGTTVNKCSPGTVAGGGITWRQVSAGSQQTAATKTDGTLWIWGLNNLGNLGDGTTVSRCSPGTVAGGGTWCRVDGDGTSFSAIKTDGTLWTWGWNNNGVLGDGTTVSRCSPGTVAGGGTTWCLSSANIFTTAAIKTDGTLWTWGCNCRGQLGDGTTVDRCSPGSIAIQLASTPEDFLMYAEAVAQVTNNRQVSVASSSELPDIYSSCIPNGQMVFVEDKNLPVIANGHDWDGLDGRTLVSGPKFSVFSWGVSAFGALGDGGVAGPNKSSPGTIWGSYTTWCQVSAGNFQSAAVKTDGTLWTWGYGTCGRLGSGTTTSRRSPGTVAGGGTTWCQVSVGCRNTAAIKTDGTLWTWGDNTQGRLGDGTTVFRSSPGTVAGGGTTWCQVSTKKNRTLAIKTDGTLWSWGCNGGILGAGALGDGTTVARFSPGTVAGEGTTWCQVSVGDEHTSAIKTDGTLWTWGCNGSITTAGGLGDGTTVNRTSPGTVAGGGTTWCQVSNGNANTAAIKTDGTLWTWGNNTCGQLGSGNLTLRCSPGTVAGGGSTWCQVSLSDSNFVLSVKTDGTLWTWGRNYGELGDGTTVSRCSPGTIAGDGTNWCQVSGGWCHSLAITKQ